MSTNFAIATGRLTREIEVRFTGNGIAVGNVTLAVERNFKNASGEYETDFINGVIWRKPAETLASFTTKGSLITIQGAIQTGSYENKEGQTVNTTEINIDSFQLLESKQVTDERREKNGGESSAQSNTSNSKQSKNEVFSTFDTSDSNPFEDTDVTDISSDDLPF